MCFSPSAKTTKHSCPTETFYKVEDRRVKVWTLFPLSCKSEINSSKSGRLLETVWPVSQSLWQWVVMAKAQNLTTCDDHVVTSNAPGSVWRLLMIGRLFSCPILFYNIVKHLHHVTQSKASWMSVVMKSYIFQQWGEGKKIKHRRKAFLL